MATATPPSSVYPAAPPPDSQEPYTPPASQEGEEVAPSTSTVQVGGSVIVTVTCLERGSECVTVSCAQPPKVTLMVRPKAVATESPSNSEPTPAPDGLAKEEVGVSPENGMLSVSMTSHVSDSSIPRDEELCDDENPEVNLHEFLIQQLKEPK